MALDRTVPVAAPSRRGRPRAWPLREIVNAIFYVMRGGIAWRLLPSDFPPWRHGLPVVCDVADGCLFERINHALVIADRERVGRERQSLRGDHRQPEREDDRERRAAWLRRRQEDQRSQAPRARRHGRPRSPARAASGEHPGPRWRRTRVAGLAPFFPLSSGSSPTAAMPASEVAKPPASPSKSSASSPIKSASPSSRGAGWSSASSPGSAATEGSPRTSKPPSLQRRAFLYAASVMLLIRRLGQTFMTFETDFKRFMALTVSSNRCHRSPRNKDGRYAFFRLLGG